MTSSCIDAIEIMINAFNYTTLVTVHEVGDARSATRGVLKIHLLG